MVGICTALIGLVKIIEARIDPTHVDESGGLAALLLLVSDGLLFGSSPPKPRASDRMVGKDSGLLLRGRYRQPLNDCSSLCL